ncbi:MAG: hypothetical protein ABIG52_00025 [Nanoarchaeota archaeon]
MRTTVNEWLQSPEIVELMKREKLGTYTIIEDDYDSPEVKLVRVKHDDRHTLCCLRWTESIDHTLVTLWSLRRDTEDQLGTMRENPVLPEYKWWSTGELRNGDTVRYHQTEMARLAVKIKNIDCLMDELEQGTYKIGAFSL